MSGFFSGLGGARFPDVVMNSGPLPPTGGLPAPLHDTADARINYNSTLLGNLEPYAYGEPGNQSSQNGYLNIPHRIQKICPALHLPEARQKAASTFELSHPIDDGDIAFVLRLNRGSIFCTGLKNGEMKRMGLGTAIDPMINLCTLNYLLSGIQLARDATGAVAPGLWWEFLHNLDAARWNPATKANTFTLDDIIHFVRHCVRPFGITRGSEKQGGQNEASQSPATWPVCFVVSLVLDGKEANVVNIWHRHHLSSGDDLVLRLRRVKVRPYTLNHYYKRVVRQDWGELLEDPQYHYAWQLVPDVFSLEEVSKEEEAVNTQAAALMPAAHQMSARYFKTLGLRNVPAIPTRSWQELGYWHIGRSQVMMGKYGIEDYYFNDMANDLKTNHLDMTFQPYFTALPVIVTRRETAVMAPSVYSTYVGKRPNPEPEWTPSLRLETGLSLPPASLNQPVAARPVQGRVRFVEPIDPAPALASQEEPREMLEVAALSDTTIVEPVAAALEVEAVPTIPVPGLTSSSTTTKARGGNTGTTGAKKRGQGNSGSLLKTDGNTEAHQVEML